MKKTHKILICCCLNIAIQQPQHNANNQSSRGNHPTSTPCAVFARSFQTLLQPRAAGDVHAVYWRLFQAHPSDDTRLPSLTARKALGSGGRCSPKHSEMPGAPHSLSTERLPGTSVEIYWHKATSIPKPAFVVPIEHKHQLYGMSYANIACIWTLYKATYTIPVQHTLIHTHWHSVINQSTLQEQDLRFTANMVRLFIQSYGVITVGKAWQYQSWSQV